MESRVDRVIMAGSEVKERAKRKEDENNEETGKNFTKHSIHGEHCNRSFRSGSANGRCGRSDEISRRVRARKLYQSREV